MNRAERIRRKHKKIEQRVTLMHSLGMQAGTLYAKHRNKINASSGYMSTGNVSHYASTKRRKKFNRYKGVKLMNITLKMFRQLFTTNGNTLNQFWLFNKDGKYLKTIDEDSCTNFDCAVIKETYMHMDESNEIPVLCIHLDV